MSSLVPGTGSTLINYTNEWQAGRWDLPGLLAELAREGVGPDVELVGYQSFRTLPFPGDEEVRAFRAALDRWGLRPVCFGVYAEWLRRRDRWADEDEVVQSLEAQLDTAARLGFPLVRGPVGISPAVMGRLLPSLERHGIVFTVEVQGPARAEDGALGDLLAGLRRLDSAYLGITLDTSVAMPRIPVSLLDHLRARGASRETCDLLAAWWDGADLGPALAAAGAQTHGPQLVPLIMSCFFRFGRSAPEDWVDWLPWTRHVHAKIWDWVDPDLDVVAPQGAFVELLTEHGYAGSVVSEWGGSAWLDSDDVDPLRLTRDHLDLIRTMRAPARAVVTEAGGLDVLCGRVVGGGTAGGVDTHHRPAQDGNGHSGPDQ